MFFISGSLKCSISEIYSLAACISVCLAVVAVSDALVVMGFSRRRRSNGNWETKIHLNWRIFLFIYRISLDNRKWTGVCRHRPHLGMKRNAPWLPSDLTAGNFNEQLNWTVWWTKWIKYVFQRTNEWTRLKFDEKLLRTSFLSSFSSSYLANIELFCTMSFVFQELNIIRSWRGWRDLIKDSRWRRTWELSWRGNGFNEQLLEYVLTHPSIEHFCSSFRRISTPLV